MDTLMKLVTTALERFFTKAREEWESQEAASLSAVAGVAP
jgi:hypothetical protein